MVANNGNFDDPQVLCVIHSETVALPMPLSLDM